MANELNTVEMTEERLDNLEKGDVVRHKDDPEGVTREVTREPEFNGLQGGVVQAQVQQGTVSRSSVDNWELVQE